MNRRHLKLLALKIPGGTTLLRFVARYFVHEINARRHLGPALGAAERFRKIHEDNEWGNQESVSGDGSTLQYTANIRREIPRLAEQLGVQSILDAPCGDFNWFRAIEWLRPVRYTGGDIVEALIERNQRLYGDETRIFSRLNIINDPLPKADLWLNRDCLFHLPEREIFLVLDNFLRSEIQYLLTSVHGDVDFNTDIPMAWFRMLDLRLPPFRLGEPERMIDDWIPGHPVRYLGLWHRETVERRLFGNKQFRKAVKSRRR